MDVVKSLFSYNKLARVALPIVLVIAVAGTLWFGTPTPTKALQMQITNDPNSYVAVPYTFSVAVTIEDGEMVPIDSIDLTITNHSGNTATCTDLPLTDGGTKSYTTQETGGGPVDVTASAVINQQTAAGYFVWQGNTYTTETSVPVYAGPSTITYLVVWTPPQDWPEGSYDIQASINNPAQADINTQSSFTLAAPTMLAETNIEEALNGDGFAVVKVNIVRVKDPSNDQTVALDGGLGTYTAQIVLPDGGIEILGVNGNAETGTVAYNALTGEFSVASIASPMQPSNTTVAEIVVKLTGNNVTFHNLTVAFTHIGAVNAPATNVPSDGTHTMTFMRGDANEDGDRGIGDALFIAQYLVGQKTYSDLGAINGACVSHDNPVNGDTIGIGDALFIAQYLVGQKDADFNAVP